MSLLVHADCFGVPGQGVEAGAGVFGLRQRGAQLLLLAFALNCVATILTWRREAEALKYPDALLALTVEHGFSNWQSFGQLVHGQSLALLGKADEAVAEIKSALELFEASGGVVPGWGVCEPGILVLCGPRLKRG